MYLNPWHKILFESKLNQNYSPMISFVGKKWKKIVKDELALSWMIVAVLITTVSEQFNIWKVYKTFFYKDREFYKLLAYAKELLL